MKKIILAAAAALVGFNASALTTGDLAFTSFNADEDGWSMVTFVDLAANTQIFFSDGTAASASTIGTTESAFSWDTGSNVVAAGTVVRFSAIDVAARAASVGSFSAVNSANFGLSAGAETIYAFLGSSATSVTTMLTAVSSEANTNSLTTVGLTAGTNAVKLTSSTDFAGYTGLRSGNGSFASYAPLVNTAANWAIDVGGNGTTVLPSTTNFSVTSPVPEPESYAMLLAGLGLMATIARRRSNTK